VILRCNYEESNALAHGVRAFLGGDLSSTSPVAAPPEERVLVEGLSRRLGGDISVDTLAEQRALERAVEAVVTQLRVEMETAVAHTHPAHEGAVAAYFEFAHAYAVLARLREMGAEMAALIELVSGAPPTDELARSFVFPD